MKSIILGEIAKIEISGVDKKSFDNEIPVRLCNFVDVYYNWAITSDMYSAFMEATAKPSEVERFSLKKGQVALTKDSETRDDIGIPAYIADDFDGVILGYHNALITPDESQLDGKYLNALLHTDYARLYFSRNASGSGQRYSLSVDALDSFPVLLPSLEEQKRIGHIFSRIDQKILLNRSINHYLEEMAKQLYDYWFVQFDFPDENGRPYKSSGGKMVWDDTLKRYIPEGWEVINLFDGVDVQYGFPFSTEYFTTDKTPFPIVRIRDIKEGTCSAYTTETPDEKYRLYSGDVVVGMDGNFHMNIWHNGNNYLNQRCVRFRAKEDSPISGIQALFETAPYIKTKEANAKGSTVGHLSDKDLKSMWLTYPRENEHFKPRCIFDSLSQHIGASKCEIETLIHQRDELLPLLMSGQVSTTPLNNDLSLD